VLRRTLARKKEAVNKGRDKSAQLLRSIDTEEEEFRNEPYEKNRCVVSGENDSDSFGTLHMS